MRHRVAVVVPLLVALALASSGCGNLSRGELERGVATLGSIAAEGELLAGDVERDRTKSTFARVRARELSDEADHEAEKLHDATPTGDIARERDRAVALAEQLAETLRVIQVAPGDEGRAREVRARLSRQGDVISDLQGDL
jgi:hypothetical protein